METLLEASQTNPNSRLQITTTRKGVIWLDQVSSMPTDTYKVCVSKQENLELKMNSSFTCKVSKYSVVIFSKGDEV